MASEAPKAEAPKPATYDDVLNTPPHMTAHVIEGVLYTQPRPAIRHAKVASRLGVKLGARFDDEGGDHGGWIILDEPELHLGPRPDIVVPDLAGWRLTTLSELPDAAYLTVSPDWTCEILSPSTRRFDRVLKLQVYRREGVKHVWLIDPEAKTLEVFRLDGEHYSLLATHSEADVVRAEPFDAMELGLDGLWMR